MSAPLQPGTIKPNASCPIPKLPRRVRTIQVSQAADPHGGKKLARSAASKSHNPVMFYRAQLTIPQVDFKVGRMDPRPESTHRPRRKSEPLNGHLRPSEDEEFAMNLDYIYREIDSCGPVEDKFRKLFRSKQADDKKEEKRSDTLIDDM